VSTFNLELPTIQNWSCQSCGGCCKQHGIYITEEEKLRIEKQGWTPADGIPADQPIFVKMGGKLGKTWHRLAHQPDGACVFLDERGLCRIHAKFGEPAKPLACRIYPYAFHPAGSKITVGLRFSCPSVVANKGRGVTAQRDELKDLARQVVPAKALTIKAPWIVPGRRVDWADFQRFIELIDQVLADEEADIVSKLLVLLGVMDLIEQAKFDKLTGSRLDEFLGVITAGVAESLDPDAIAEPTKIGRTQFRQLAGQYARSDTYGSKGGSLSGRWKLLKAALKLASGRGETPALQADLPPVPFEKLEQPFGIPEGTDELFERYFRVKAQGLSFCGRAYYDAPLVEGFRSLALVFPAVMWIARWIASGAGRSELRFDDVARALSIADHHHGYSPAFGTWGFRKRVQTMAKLGDIPRLIAWYSR
jgi:lysine-N-methylase